MDPHHLRPTYRLVCSNLSTIHAFATSNPVWRFRFRLGDIHRSAYVLGAHLPKPETIPSIHADFGPYLAFDLNYAAIWAIATELYYFVLTPVVTVSHLPHTRTHPHHAGI